MKIGGQYHKLLMFNDQNKCKMGYHIINHPGSMNRINTRWLVIYHSCSITRHVVIIIAKALQNGVL
jgi:hypothetical protein